MKNSTLKLCGLLIWSQLLLVTNFPKTAYCQPEQIQVSAMSTAMARTNEGACVHEQIGRPFRPWDGVIVPGLDHWTPECPPSNEMLQFQSFANSPCSFVLFSWAQDPADAWEPWGSLLWAPDGTLRMVEIIGCRRNLGDGGGITVGQWCTNDGYGSEIPAPLAGQPSWAEFTAGTPIEVVIDWNTANDWIILESIHADLPAFTDAYGFDPRDALLHVRITYFTDVEPPMQDGYGLLGSWLTLHVDVERAGAGDWTRDRGVNASDIFAFLADWCQGTERAADCDGCDGCSGADIFAFLADWFGGE